MWSVGRQCAHEKEKVIATSIQITYSPQEGMDDSMTVLTGCMLCALAAVAGVQERGLFQVGIELLGQRKRFQLIKPCGLTNDKPTVVLQGTDLHET